MWLSIVTLHGSPHEIALGAAVGMFIGLTPTFGIQIILAIVVSTALKCSRPAAFVTVWVTNVFTLVPIYAFCYVVGQWFHPGKGYSIEEAYDRFEGLLRVMRKFEFWEIWSQSVEMTRMVGNMFVPLLIGGVLVGLVAGAITYGLTLWGVNRYRRLREAIKTRHYEELPGIGKVISIVKEKREERARNAADSSEEDQDEADSDPDLAVNSRADDASEHGRP